MKFKIIEGTQVAINRNLVTNKGVPKKTSTGNTKQIKNPLVIFQIERTTKETQKGFFSDTIITRQETYKVKCYLSCDNKNATHKDVLDFLNTLTPAQFADGARAANAYQYKFSVLHKYNDIYLSEIETPQQNANN